MASVKTKKAAEGNGEQAGEAHLAGMVEAAKQETAVRVDKPIILPELQIETIKVRVVGDTPLLVHRFSEKAIKMILDKQTGEATTGREPKVPEEDYRRSLYICENGRPGLPALAFKCAMVTACTSLGKAITKVAARQAFHVRGDIRGLVEIEGEHRMHQAMVRLSTGVADVRFRAEFPEWACWLTIVYNARVLSARQLTNLINVSGFAVGVGEHRPERNGESGCFHVGSA